MMKLIYSDLESLEKSNWAIRFKSDMGGGTPYKEALDFALNTNEKYEIYHNNENGEWVYAVIPESDPRFWMDAFPTKKEAIELVKRMGWTLIR